MDSLVTFTTTLAVGAVIYMAVNLLKYLRARNWDGVVTLLVAAVIGIGIACWMANSDLTETLRPVQDGQPLGDMDFGSLALFGVALSSTFSVVTDFIKGIDNSNTAAKPSLIPGGPGDAE